MAGFFVVVASPVIIDEFSSPERIGVLDWVRLSNIGQTYGAVAAIFSALALIAVTVSLVIQAGEAKSNRLQAVRGHHSDLLRMAIDDPALYMPFLGLPDEMEADIARRHVYAVLQMNYFRMAYESRIVSEGSLRGELLAEAFQVPFMRDWWRGARSAWKLGTRGTIRQRRFFKIVDGEYAKALASTVKASQDVQPGELGVDAEPATLFRRSVYRGILWTVMLSGVVYILKKLANDSTEKSRDGMR
ncbi:DUF6082 family protein [Sphaerisporangium sp. NPDC049002]|uniref:DUF6082 family protein n=1 Tax=Sphaerisporangium sp. NPDC049002 TaxID=3155392 RepID=UPI0033C7D5A1